MAQGWTECPALGPGWQRREAFRKSGATCGRTDTYYKSPTGEKFRSKIELSRFLGPNRDLGNFDFKHGLERPGPSKGRKGPKWRPPPPPPPPAEEMEAPPPLEEVPPPLEEVPPPLEEVPPLKEETTPPQEEAPPLQDEAPPPPTQEARPPPRSPPLPSPGARGSGPPPPPEPPQEGVVACCASCQSHFPGVTLPPQRRCRWLCPECRARRRDFNREQRFFKRVGCGSCQACRLPADCGICSACARPPPAPARPHKCLLRRCLRIVKKGLGCGSCPGCVATEDCGSCPICLRRLKPGLKRQWRCLRRRCLRPKKPTKEKEKKKPGRPPKHPASRGGERRGRRPRRCGTCAACQRRGDCGRCDFCRDKAKFGGRNRKRQKCRWRQCLRRAMRRLLPAEGGSDLGGAPPCLPPSCRRRRRCPPPRANARSRRSPRPPLKDPEPQAGGGEKGGAPPLPPPPMKEEPGPLPRLEPPPGDLGVLIAASPRLKPEPGASLVPVPPRAPPARLVLLEESEDDDEDGGQRLPLPPPPAPRWPSSFLAELAEIPLPAHWGVVGGPEAGVPPASSSSSSSSSSASSSSSPLSSSSSSSLPGLRLVQRSPRSPMAATVVLLAPGLAFRVLVAQNRPVPPGHEVLASRPPRLRSVEDLVELLCDLEAYRPCQGPPGAPPRPPAPRCQVLVPGGSCCRPCLLLGGGGDP
ncbi:LOW QUALITY PROTEIN: methyl-CpG-binding domain protein 1-like [Phaenicophaeus curvirostris]|uniref:LOW QUALITY PROTEIN: methyl-CpG-binding domain protein 1-like n=1 Tax=Phaenicophaeus curvirostris TaxID=33595 RepID=UPI0037F0AA76